LLHGVEISDGVECLSFAKRGSLPVTHVQQCYVPGPVFLDCQCRAYTRVHAAAKQYYGTGFFLERIHDFLDAFGRRVPDKFMEL
jgi:hypothetical protein